MTPRLTRAIVAPTGDHSHEPREHDQLSATTRDPAVLEKVSGEPGQLAIRSVIISQERDYVKDRLKKVSDAAPIATASYAGQFEQIKAVGP